MFDSEYFGPNAHRVHSSSRYPSAAKSSRSAVRGPMLGTRTLLVAAGLVWCVGGCQQCDKCSTLIVEMPNVDAQQTYPPVIVVMQPAASSSPTITCAWAQSTWPGGEWTCTKDNNGTTSGHDYPRFTYDIPNAGGSWTITFTGPSGTKTVTRSPGPGNAGDGAPIGCTCDAYEFHFTSDDMGSVGIVFGSSTGNYVGVDAG